HGNDLQAVGERLYLVRRKLDVMGRQRARRPLRRPGNLIGTRARGAQTHKADRQPQDRGEARRRPGDDRSSVGRGSTHDGSRGSETPEPGGGVSAPGRAPVPGTSVMISLFSGRKKALATRWTSAVVMF